MGKLNFNAVVLTVIFGFTTFSVTFANYLSKDTGIIFIVFVMLIGILISSRIAYINEKRYKENEKQVLDLTNEVRQQSYQIERQTEKINLLTLTQHAIVIERFLYIIGRYIARFDRESVRVYALSLSKSKKKLMIYAEYGVSESDYNRLIFERSKGIIGEVFDRGKPNVGDRTKLQQDWLDVWHLPEIAPVRYVQTVIAIPILTKEDKKVLGVLVIDTPETLVERNLDDRASQRELLDEIYQFINPILDYFPEFID